ncbi:type II secretion system F family protein [Ornithinimicrobium flavum]|uniref:type II secretion system F family protein n=1 Tax=Ornithinimicrobium flavum TaxID=1288636 RepID=UPI00107063E5|nr:type II secretion system F family protein [Ornithinimicrobium flavum]
MGLAGVVIALLLALPNRRLPHDRRRHGAEETSAVTRAAGVATGWIGRRLDQGGRGRRWADALNLAGIRMDVADFVLVVGAAMLAAFALGLVVQGLILAVLLAVVTLIAVLFWVSIRADMRRTRFADQIDDVVTLLASNMRAGHSLVQGLHFVAQEVEDPAAGELARIVNEARVGRDLNASLAETAERMDSDDFRWIGQAIMIHRQVGGNLAEVLDTVGETVRERGQIRRQVRALAAEGKLSAIILMALPFVMTGLLILVNPTYIGVLVQSTLGWAMIFAGVIMLTLGGLWLRKVIEVKF